MLRNREPRFSVNIALTGYVASTGEVSALKIPQFHGWRNKLGVWLGDWVTVCSLSDISGLRRPKSVKFGTKVASNTRMMGALRFL